MLQQIIDKEQHNQPLNNAPRPSVTLHSTFIKLKTFSWQDGSSGDWQGLREPCQGFQGEPWIFFSHFSQSIRNSIKIVVFIIHPCDNYLMCRHDHARVLLEEQKNSSSPATSPASSQAAFPDDSITRDCVTWTPLPTQYRCLLFQIFHSMWIVANM